MRTLVTIALLALTLCGCEDTTEKEKSSIEITPETVSQKNIHVEGYNLPRSYYSKVLNKMKKGETP